MPADKIHQRLTALFSEIEELARKADNVPPDILRQIEGLRARVLELEKEISSEKSIPIQKDVSPETNSKLQQRAPILYEKEQVGYAYSEDNLHALQNLDLQTADHKDTLNVPLIASGENIGGLQITASSNEHAWTSEETSLAHSVAQQVSLQVQNLRLLSATERARFEAETSNRRFTHESWDSFLDAINQKERVGYLYDQSSVAAFDREIPRQDGFTQALTLTQEQVGTLFIQDDPARPLTQDDKELINATARQLTQQIESLRLLADASRARAEAESSARSLTRHNWDAFTDAHAPETLGFSYDALEVKALDDNADLLNQKNMHAHALTVRGETIGHLATLSETQISPQDAGVVAVIATQVSLHIETLRLTEELQQRAKELQELDRLKSSFLANMSHELRTPLNSILGFADVMLEELDGPLTENMQNDLGLIYKNGQHLLHLINDVLDMAKIESGKMNLTIEKFNLQEIIEEVTSITSTLASEKNLSLFIDSDSDHEVEINADKIRLRQVLINLINNSIKFTEKGKISIHVTRETSNVLISIKDTGIGIPADLLESIFLEFTQVDTTTTRKTGGTGLGLPISRRLVEMHSGRLWAESSGVDGEGSTFYVFLPIEANINENPSQSGK